MRSCIFYRAFHWVCHLKLTFHTIQLWRVSAEFVEDTPQTIESIAKKREPEKQNKMKTFKLFLKQESYRWSIWFLKYCSFVSLFWGSPKGRREGIVCFLDPLKISLFCSLFSINKLCSRRFSRRSAPIHWLVHGHMTSNSETVSRQMPRAGNIAKTVTSNVKQFTVTREMLTAVARDR